MISCNRGGAFASENHQAPSSLGIGTQEQKDTKFHSMENEEAWSNASFTSCGFLAVFLRLTNNVN
jgi:hypothetical protein